MRHKRSFAHERKGNISRFANQLTGFVNKADTDTSTSHSKLPSNKPLQRKLTRKNMRILKKAKRAAFYENKKMPTIEDILNKSKPKRKKKKKPKHKPAEKNALEENTNEESDSDAGDRDAAADQKILKDLERRLKLTGKNKLPRAFANEGLDYILETIGSYDSTGKCTNLHSLPTSAISTDEKRFADEDVSDEDDSDEDVYDISLDDEISSHDEIDDTEDDRTADDYIIVTDNSDEIQNKSIMKRKSTFSDATTEKRSKVVSFRSGPDSIQSEEKLKEDIYGRLRDAEGNVVPEPVTQQRNALNDVHEGDCTALDKLRKKLRALINRASEKNMTAIHNEIEQIYRENPRAHVNEILTTLILTATVNVSLTPERLMMELMLLVAILHSNVGSEVGGYFLQSLIQKFDKLFYNCEEDSKEIDNTVTLLANLYNFEVVHGCLICDVLNKLCERFTIKDIGLIILLVKNVGFSLRKDDPLALKSLITEVQSKCSNLDLSDITDKSRVQFMLDTLLAIRNNNMKKIQHYDPTHINHLRKNLHNYITGSRGDSKLRVHYDELLNADKHGRWWVVGSSWTGASNLTKKDCVKGGSVDTNYSKEILQLAANQRMNTDIRRSIFCVIMTADDYVDAYEKLVRLDLHHKQEREIIHVIIDCCLQEESFNSFYAYLLHKICSQDRRYQMTFQFSVWDKLRNISDMTDINRANLARLVAHLVVTKSASLSILKVIEFGFLTKETSRFLKELLMSLVRDHPLGLVKECTERIAVQSKLKQLNEGLKLYIQHFLLKKDKDNKVSGHLQSICDILTSNVSL